MFRHVAIVGAGFSGTMFAVNLLRHEGVRVTLIDRVPSAGRGVAYATPCAAHLLNVRADSMSAYADRPGHFADWLTERDQADSGAVFAPRAAYGDYLAGELDAATRRADGALRVVTGAVADISTDGGVRLSLESGETIVADAAVLATGNLPPLLPSTLNEVAQSPRFFGDPWNPAFARGLSDSDTILLIGSGLTAVDAVLTLRAERFGGRIVALSRRGLMPRSHADPAPDAPPPPTRPRGLLSALVRQVRDRARTVGWREAVDELRPFTQEMWQDASDAERSRFLRHLRPWWDVHRHRIAPAVAETIERARRSGQLTVAAGKIERVEEAGDGIAVDWRPRGDSQVQRLTVQRIVNCTGPQSDISRTDDPLMARLVPRSTVRPDAARIGIDIDHGSHVVSARGEANPRLFAVGPMTRGALWEIVAVPDIRHQVADLADQLAGRSAA